MYGVHAHCFPRRVRLDRNDVGVHDDRRVADAADGLGLRRFDAESEVDEAFEGGGAEARRRDVEHDIARRLLEEAEQSCDYKKATELLGPLLEGVFKTARVSWVRRARGGRNYSLIEQAVMQFLHWSDMPWE